MFKSVTDAVSEKTGGKIPFADTGTKIKAYFSQIAENKRMGSDLLFMVTYMASILTSDISRPEIFAYTATRKEYVTAKYIEKVETYI